MDRGAAKGEGAFVGIYYNNGCRPTQINSKNTPARPGCAKKKNTKGAQAGYILRARRKGGGGG